MRVEILLPREADAGRRNEVRSAFAASGLTIDREGLPAIKSAEILGVRIDAAFILAATIGGILWEFEKAALVRGISALRTGWEASGAVGIDYEGRPDDRPPTIYFVPGGDEGDHALAAIEEDYETAGPGQRSWEDGRWVAFDKPRH